MRKLIFSFVLCLLSEFVIGSQPTYEAKDEIKKPSNFQFINSTGIEFYIKYYLVDRNGYYLRWDGRYYYNPSNLMYPRYGLTADFHDGSINNNWYLFSIEPYANTNNISIKNVATGFYITYDWSSYFFLMNTNTSDYPISLSLLSRGNSLFSIQSVNPNYADFLSYIGGFGSGRSANISYLSPSSSTSSYTAYISFIKAIDLNAKISLFKYATISNVQNYITKFNLISPTYVNNTSPLKIVHDISTSKFLKEKIKLNIYQDLNFFEIVEIDDSLWDIFDMYNPINNLVSKTVSSYEKSKYIFEILREYSIIKSLEIPPNSKYKIEAYVEQIKDLQISFEAVAEIKGSDSIGILPGSEIAVILQTYQNFKFTITEILPTSVKCKITGYVIATLGLNNKFIATTI